MSLQHCSRDVNVKDFKKCCISNGTDDDMLWSGSEEVGNGGRGCEGTECEMERVALIGEG
jgi:hypothetical protein